VNATDNSAVQTNS